MNETSLHQVNSASTLKILDYDRLERALPALRSEWREGIPYPHITMDEFLVEEAAELLLASFDKLRNSESWISYNHYTIAIAAPERTERAQSIPGIDTTGHDERIRG